jgi:hypothetical protein
MPRFPHNEGQIPHSLILSNLYPLPLEEGKNDILEKIRLLLPRVIPAQAGKRSLMFIIHTLLKRPDSRFHGNDKLPNFRRNSNFSKQQDAVPD